MKKLLVASTALVLVAGAAVAEVKVSGNGRMGVVHNSYKVNGNEYLNGNADGWDFNSRFRVVFTASGETDGGLSFGGTIRADNAPAGANGSGGNIWISGAFGKLAMGDVDSAAEAAVGNPLRTFPGFVDDEWDHVGYVGGSASGNNPIALYEYKFGSTTVYASLADGSDRQYGTWFASQAPGARTTYEAYGIAVKHEFGDYTVAAGYEGRTEGAGVSKLTREEASLGVTAVYGDLYAKVIYQDGTNDEFGVANDYGFDTVALGLEYQIGETKLIGYYTAENRDWDVGSYSEKTEAFGVGASYNLGGGASLLGGISRLKEIEDTGAGVKRTWETTRAQVGLSFTF